VQVLVQDLDRDLLQVLAQAAVQDQVMVQPVKKAKRTIMEITLEMEIIPVTVIIRVNPVLMANQMISHKAVQTANLIIQKIVVRMLTTISLIASHKIRSISLN